MTNYEDDDRMLDRIMAEAAPKWVDGRTITKPLTSAQRAEAEAALKRMGKPWLSRKA
jgi:hypothetical protein